MHRYIAPHCAMPQPNLVPVMPITFRIALKSGMSGSMVDLVHLSM
jgi:hypothetical protein